MSSAVIKKQKLSLKAQTASALAAIAGSVVLPQLFHVMGIVSGLGTAPGEIFLPMHLPIILAGFLAGPYVGLIAGFIAPILSFLMTGMPSIAMLPFMAIELSVYGVSSGLIANLSIPSVLKVVSVQVFGRLIRAAAILIAVYAIGSTKIPVSVIWTSITKGIFGIALQWLLIPLIIYRVENISHDRKS